MIFKMEKRKVDKMFPKADIKTQKMWKEYYFFVIKSLDPLEFKRGFYTDTGLSYMKTYRRLLHKYVYTLAVLFLYLVVFEGVQGPFVPLGVVDT